VKKIFLPVVLLLFAVSINGQQQDFSQVQIKATKVAGNVYMLEGSGGNIGVSVGADGILIVDDQFAPLADKIRAMQERLAWRSAQNRRRYAPPPSQPAPAEAAVAPAEAPAPAPQPKSGRRT
jgi:hypothetical protein